jgi:hypothetical protein
MWQDFHLPQALYDQGVDPAQIEDVSAFDIANMVLNAAAQQGDNWDDLIILKTDIDGAYPHIPLDVQGMLNTAMSFVCKGVRMVAIMFVLNFGQTGAGFKWEKVALALLFSLNESLALLGTFWWLHFVDDFFTVVPLPLIPIILASNSGLRPSEWSPFYSSANAKPIALAVNTYVGNVHTDQWVRLTRLAQQPPQDYTSILILLTSKADPQGKAPCRTISRHSGGPHARFTDAFESILGVLKDYPPLDTVGAGIFSGIPDPRLLQFQVREVLGRVALELNLPRERLTLHSMRLFILAQLMAADVDTGTIRLMVGWRSESGIKPYYRSFVKKGVRFADALHDTDAISPSQLVIINSNIATPGR